MGVEYAGIIRDAMKGDEFCRKLVLERLQAPIKHKTFVSINGLSDDPVERADQINKLAAEGKIEVDAVNTMILANLRVAEKMEIQETLNLTLERLEALENGK